MKVPVAAEDQTVQDLTPAVQPASGPALELSMAECTINLRGKKTKDLQMMLRNASKDQVVFSSNRTGVAKVSSSGRIKGLKKGKAVITARIKGTDIVDRCVVNVTKYKKMRMRTTGYCNCSRCAGRWAGHATASGRMPRANHTIAVDRRLIKLGTKVEIDNRMYVAEDTGGAIKGHRIDIYYSSHSKASRHGVKYKIVKVYQ